MISRHEVKREYLALVYGHPDHQTFKVDAPIGRSKYDRLKMAVDPINGKNAVTHFTVYNQYNKGALVELIKLEFIWHMLDIQLSVMRSMEERMIK